MNEWNVHKRVLRKMPRTNNPLEGLHNALNRTIGKANPTIWQVLKAFQDEEANARLKINHVNRGERPKQPKVYRDVNERIFNLVSNYENEWKNDRIKFLRMISYNLKKVEIVEEENIEPENAEKENA